jgi:ABC-2 type transport system ATP-binding protein
LSGERIVILSTHIVSDIEAVASSIAILGQGELLAQDAPEALLARLAGCVWEVVVSSTELPKLRRDHLVSSTAHRSDGVHARVVSNSAPTPLARPLEPSLEDVYLAALSRQRNRDAAPEIFRPPSPPEVLATSHLKAHRGSDARHSGTGTPVSGGPLA